MQKAGGGHLPHEAKERIGDELDAVEDEQEIIAVRRCRYGGERVWVWM